MTETQILTGEIFAEMIKGGAANLAKNRVAVNELNVFPVPDGDTGDNMFMTADSGVFPIDADNPSLGEVAQETAHRMLLGARGNSGVILSRIFAGIAKALDGKTVADVATLASAMDCGVAEAYASVSVPVEGTILTVLRESVQFANSRINGSTTLGEYLENIVLEAGRSLERTPSLLDVLEKAGVVDSGGAGFFFIAEGMNNAVRNEGEIDNYDSVSDRKPVVDYSLFGTDSVLEYGYCTEFLLRLQSSKVNLDSFDEKAIVDFLSENGESVVAFRDGSIVKVHVHTMTPGIILNECQKYGEFLTVKIENMSLQHSEAGRKNDSVPELRHSVRKKYATVVVASGSGIKGIFEELGADYIVEGGQSMNPSAEDFIRAFDCVNAETILVFPNNKNILLTAKQAAELYDSAEVGIVPTRSIGEGYAAFSMLDTSSGDTAAIIEELTGIAQSVVTGLVCKATRDTDVNGLHVTQGNYIGFSQDTIYCDCAERREAVKELARKLNAGSYDILILLCGEESDPEEASTLCSALQAEYPRTEVIIQNGSQPIYDYVMILE